MLDRGLFRGYTNCRMKITFDEAKRAENLHRHGLDFGDAAEVFGGTTFDRIDARHDYGETRVITVGHLRGRMVVVVISMRKANDREKKRFGERLGEG